MYDEAGGLVQLEIQSVNFSRLVDLGTAVTKLRDSHRALVSYSILAALKHQVMV